MVPILAALLGLLFLGATSARADLDLTASAGSKTLDNIAVPNVVFHDGGTEITYQPPRGWICSGSPTCANLSIPDHPLAKATIQTAPRLRVPAFDDTVVKVIQANPALLQLPKGARDIKITAVTVNPLVIDSHPTLEIDISYSFFGQACAKSILLCNRKGAEVSFVLDCLASDFGVLENKFRRSLFSIENL